MIESIATTADRSDAVLLVLPKDARTHDAAARWPLFSEEVLAHGGVSFDTVHDLSADLSARSVILFATPPSLTTAEIERLRVWAGSGGSVVGVGGAGDLARLVRVADGPELTNGVRILIDHSESSVPAFGGRALSVSVSDNARVFARTEDGDAVAVAVAMSSGSVQVWGIDLWQTVVRVMQGWPVRVDGEPASDGSLPVDDGFLKCDDGIVLDPLLDRRVPPGQPDALIPYPYEFPPASSPPVFATPVADVWRSAFLRRLVAPVSGTFGVPFVEYWPAGEAAVVHISQDADGNVQDEAAAALALWSELDVRTTWCMLFPGGYGCDLLEQAVREGHEVALHYSALGDTDIGRWGFAELRAQVEWLRAWTGGLPIVTNKNHYTRWEGWSEFFVWCERLGIELDQTRGPSKLGGVGFPFGTSHLWRPLTDGAGDGRLVDVLAMPLHTQDLGLAAHESIRDVILDQAEEHGGVAHFLFHPTHIHERELVRGACRRLIDEVRRRGLPILTAQEINGWERSRRTIRVQAAERDSGALVLTVSAPADLQATVAVPLSDAAFEAGCSDVTVGGEPVRTSALRRRGTNLLLVAVDVPAGLDGVKLEVRLKA